MKVTRQLQLTTTRKDTTVQIFTNIGPRFAPIYGDVPMPDKADRQRQHAERQRVVTQSAAAIAKLRGVAPQRATVTAPVASQPRVSRADEQVRLNRELRQTLATSQAYREQARAQKAAAAISYQRNPREIREAHEAESRRLAKLEREIQAEIRQATWNHC